MKNLLDVKLTNQERQHIILKSVDKDYRQRIEEEQKQTPDARCFFSHWIVSGEDILKFNRGSGYINSWFDFYEEDIEKFDPRLSFGMLEGERIEEGEWDETYQRWAPHSYQRVYAIAMNALCYGFEEDGFIIQSPKVEEVKDPMEFHSKYPNTWKLDGTTKTTTPLGLLDIPLEMLEDYEDKRVQKRLFSPNNFYHKAKFKVIEDRQKSIEKKARRSSYKNSKRKNSSFKKSFSGGFA